MFIPEGKGVNVGVGAFDKGLGALSGNIEYIMIFAKEAY